MQGTETDIPDDIALNDMVCFAVYSAGHAFNRVYKPLLDRLGLTYPQFLTMIALWNEDDQTVGSLGTKLSLESSTLTPLLKRLEGMGHIERHRDKADERVVRIRLTSQGRSLKDGAKDIPGCIVAATGMPVGDLIRLQREIMTLRKSLEASLA
ncbi:MarR family winged helix-turn-helix transcriptional regulator [Gimibacter soli]|uniref:MarR family transcriptional regulator n=1 Tax=Gimibacter soli TaxID=3024400 RepID=A0AAE9XNX9_9PROT|nr:MarR family transcriptional regulator [Gimibacter soli]WCL53527.1 MarR family transcriptional regulator [Gimibacter soli]